jgi:2-amino-4-hydroxy-6-hydroxymethyldihydropteridine diphosphokinase
MSQDWHPRSDQHGVQCKRAQMLTRRVYLSLGSNVGDREANLRRAIELLSGEHIPVVKQSSIYETEPQDVPDQPWFYNLVAECETPCFPLQLLSILQGIEQEAGRTRGTGEVRRGPRVIDIDILLCGEVTMELPQLTIPHPRMRERRFVLQPLAEIAPELRDVRTGQLFREFLPKVVGQQTRKVTL